MEYSIAHRTDRRSIRHAAELECHVVAERGFRRIGGKTVDVSPTGLRIASDSAVNVGEQVVLSVKLPRGRTWVDAHGRVARVEHGTREGDSGRTIAIQFTSMDPVDHALLAGATASIPPPIPRRLIRKDYAASVLGIAEAC
jgi:hypothetical protein